MVAGCRRRAGQSGGALGLPAGLLPWCRWPVPRNLPRPTGREAGPQPEPVLRGEGPREGKFWAWPDSQPPLSSGLGDGGAAARCPWGPRAVLETGPFSSGAPEKPRASHRPDAVPGRSVCGQCRLGRAAQPRAHAEARRCRGPTFPGARPWAGLPSAVWPRGGPPDRALGSPEVEAPGAGLATCLHPQVRRDRTPGLTGNSKCHWGVPRSPAARGSPGLPGAPPGPHPPRASGWGGDWRQPLVTSPCWSRSRSRVGWAQGPVSSCCQGRGTDTQQAAALWGFLPGGPGDPEPPAPSQVGRPRDCPYPGRWGLLDESDPAR